MQILAKRLQRNEVITLQLDYRMMHVCQFPNKYRTLKSIKNVSKVKNTLLKYTRYFKLVQTLNTRNLFEFKLYTNIIKFSQNIKFSFLKVVHIL